VRVAVLGLSFRPDTDDLRESPAFPVLRRLREAGAALSAYDPVARPESHPDLCGVRLAPTLEAALADAEVVVLVTRWAEFAAVPELLARLGRAPLLVDGRRVFPPQSVARYEGIGR
jgi:UDPglucose 6-dehydrogenase/GDP-mannose 6-dehydrogenase